MVVVQHFKKDALPDALGDLILLRQRKYGDTVLSFYRKGSAES
jgi:16S rRNA G966 N2-methylase RsmD